MKKKRTLLLSIFAMLFFCSCQHLPQDPTSTPTLSVEEQMAIQQQTVDAMMAMTATQDAILNPSATPLPTDTPTPSATATSSMPVIPPTLTSEPLPYYSVGNKSVLVSIDGVPVYNVVPFDRLYIEVCYENQGAGTWNANYSCQITRNVEGSTNPDKVMLGKEVATGQKACFSFNQSMAGHQLGYKCAQFALYNDAGFILTNGYAEACFNVQ